jgi:hypothetical protein
MNNCHLPLSSGALRAKPGCQAETTVRPFCNDFPSLFATMRRDNIGNRAATAIGARKDSLQPQKPDQDQIVLAPKLLPVFSSLRDENRG